MSKETIEYILKIYWKMLDALSYSLLREEEEINLFTKLDNIYNVIINDLLPKNQYVSILKELSIFEPIMREYLDKFDYNNADKIKLENRLYFCSKFHYLSNIVKKEI